MAQLCVDLQIADIKSQVTVLLEKLERLTVQSVLGRKLTVAESVATIMHSHTCMLSHPDECTWDQENWINPGPARQKFLANAQSFATPIEKEIEEKRYHQVLS